jgi:hypothetical protein
MIFCATIQLTQKAAELGQTKLDTNKETYDFTILPNIPKIATYIPKISTYIPKISPNIPKISPNIPKISPNISTVYVILYRNNEKFHILS